MALVPYVEDEDATGIVREVYDDIKTSRGLAEVPNFWKAIALRRVACVLGTGGVLYLRDLVFAFEPDDAEARLERWLARAAERPEDGWTRAELETHLRDEHSTFAWLLEPMLERTGFAIERAEHDPLGIYAAYVCTKA